MAELRHNGAFVQRFESHDDAVAYADARSEEGWTVNDDKPVHLLCNGTLVDTFDNVTAAEAERVTRQAATVSSPRAPRNWTVSDTSKKSA